MGTGPVDVMPQSTLMKATRDSPIDNFLLSPPPALSDVLKDAQFEAVVDNDSNSFMVSSIDREASNCSSATEEQIPVSGETSLPGEEFEQCFLTPPHKLDEDNLPDDFLITTGPEDINKNNYFNKSINVPSAAEIIETPRVLDNEEIRIAHVDSKTMLGSQIETPIEPANAQFVVNEELKPEIVDVQPQQPNQYNSTVENCEKDIPTLDHQFVYSEEALPDDLKNINIKQEFGVSKFIGRTFISWKLTQTYWIYCLQCPEMTKLLPDVNLDAICKPEILDDMLILPQVPFDETFKMVTSREIQKPVAPNTSTATPEKTTPKTRKTRIRSEYRIIAVSDRIIKIWDEYFRSFPCRSSIWSW